MLKKLERKIKEKLERLPYNKITAIQRLTSVIELVGAFFNGVVLGALLTVAVMVIIVMVPTGYISVAVVIVPLIVLLIIGLINLCTKKVKRICNEIILERDTTPEIKKLRNVLSKDEYTQIICTDRYIQELKNLLEASEKQEIIYYAKLKENDNVDIILKNREGKLISQGEFDGDAFLVFYKIPDMENNM